MKIICDKISKNFTVPGGVVRVLEDFSFETQAQDFVCILGPNGCGKSTLLKIIAGIVAPSAGRVVFEGPAYAGVRATLIFPEDGLFPWLNVRDNVSFGLEMKGVPVLERYELARKLMEDMELMKFALCYPHQLSSGMKQKASLIRGLLTDAPVILMDEPDKSLDINSKRIMCEDICRVRDEYRKTVICVTHDVDMALRMAKTILVFGRSPVAVVKKIDMRPFSEMSDKQEYCFLLEKLRGEIQGIIRQEVEKVP
ncbi:MAG: ATP-binding cassette domain-containing protein [Candidatus Omnitrophica bacterium]|nr:ATP-binding cassette domain-containing protein [Candidatus Omnitrophota bacterium]